MANPDVPDGWRDNRLSSFLDDWRTNQIATFANKPEALSHLVEVDALFLRLLDGWINPRPLVPASFAFRAHAAYRAGCSAIMAGSIFEAHAVLRLCLEHGAYALFIGRDQPRWERWMRRNDDRNSRKRVRNEFTAAAIHRHIESVAPNLATQYSKLYERLIDFGAHPNEQGFSTSTVMRKVGDDVHIEAVYLHGDGLALDAALRTAAQVGFWTLNGLQLMYGERFELLGIRERLEQIRVHF